MLEIRRSKRALYIPKLRDETVKFRIKLTKQTPMKKITILAALLLAIPSLEAQKKEIKKAEKAVNSGYLSDAASYLQQAKRIFAAADNETRAHYYVVEAEMNLADKDLDKEGLESIYKSLKLASNYDPSSSLLNRITEIELKLKSLSANAATGEYSNKNFSEAATLYNVAYQSTKDTINLFNAAKSHLLAKEYNEAFSAYSRLFYMGYTGAKVRYTTSNVNSNSKEISSGTREVFTGINEVFTSSSSRNVAVEKGTQKRTQLVTTSSKIPELLRGLTTAAIHLNNESAAVAIIDEAIAKKPNDKTLLNQAFHLYRQLDAKDQYIKIMDLLIKETPNDPNLYYNFGVSSTENNDIIRAKEFYKKTLDLNPNHENAKLNLSILLLDQEKVIVDEMNSLGVSTAEDKHYEELKVKRNNLYTEVLPYLESIVASQPQNKDWVTKLMNIYSYLGQDTKLAILQEKLDD